MVNRPDAGQTSGLGVKLVAEREGFEPPELSFNGFQDRRHKPLGHLSVQKEHTRDVTVGGRNGRYGPFRTRLVSRTLTKRSDPLPTPCTAAICPIGPSTTKRSTAPARHGSR